MIKFSDHWLRDGRTLKATPTNVWFTNIIVIISFSAYEMIRLKGYTSWAIGLSVANMTQTLLRNQKNVHAISTLAKVSYLRTREAIAKC